ncbi:hypothetical protein PVAP13_5KG606400 [Panicum virgatum]|uniref:Uncharacterized protein n=1 Tax=Panicum virgatum TaxID=38727 RepID=A0A8T0SX51_PANVG|nr:hypothetical protein PVAP13_5KG606400 [Panicum virgatum]
MPRADAMRSPALPIFSRLPAPARFPSNPQPHVPHFSRVRRPPSPTARSSARLRSAHPRATTPTTCRAVTPSSLARRAAVDAEFFLREAHDLIRRFWLSCTRANQSSRRARKSRHIRAVLSPQPPPLPAPRAGQSRASG